MLYGNMFMPMTSVSLTRNPVNQNPGKFNPHTLTYHPRIYFSVGGRDAVLGAIQYLQRNRYCHKGHVYYVLSQHFAWLVD